MEPNDYSQRISAYDQWLFDPDGNMVGVKNPKAQGDDFRPPSFAKDALGQVAGLDAPDDLVYPIGTYLTFSDIGTSVRQQTNAAYSFLYFDAVNGNDANAGTYAAPKKLVASGSKAAGQQIMLMRGQTHVLVNSGTTPFTMHTGEHLGAYGPPSVERPTVVHSGTATSVIQFLNTVDGSSVSDLIIDMDGVNNRSAVSGALAGTDSQNDIHVRGCKSINGVATTYVSAFSIRGPTTGVSSGQGTVKNVTFEDCEAYRAPSMGFGAYAAVGVLEGTDWNGVDFVNCRAIDCGSDYDSHGFTAFSAGVVQGVTPSASQWVAVSGDIYYIVMSAANLWNGSGWDVGVCYIDSRSTATYYFKQNTDTPTTPAAFEYGFDSSNQRLYVNFPAASFGAGNLVTNPTKLWACIAPTRGVRWINCLSKGQLYPANSGIQEGHAFAFDDYVSNSAMLGCRAIGAAGYGLSINKGNSNRVIGNVFTDNLLAAIGGSRANGTVVSKNILRTTARGSASSIIISPCFGGNTAYTARNRFFRNAFYNTLYATTGVGIVGPDFSGWGQVASSNYFHGAMRPASGLVQISGAVASIEELVAAMNFYS